VGGLLVRPSVRLRSRQEAGVGADPERHGRGIYGWVCGGCGGKSHSLRSGGRRRDYVEWGWIGGDNWHTAVKTGPVLSHRRAKTQLLVGSVSSQRERLG
jgi:hypothetical protein